TLFGIMLANFLIVQAAPGGPVDLMIARLRGHVSQATARVGATGASETAGGRVARPGAGEEGATRASQGIDPDLVRQLEKQFGFDKPAWQRFVHMMRSYLVFDLGSSFYRDRPVLGLMLEKLPVSISLGLWTTLLALVVGGFASLAMLTKNSFLDEINKQYVATARAKGLSRRRVLYGHVFRNAMLIVIAGFPGAFIGILFAGELLIEVIFSLNGLGLLGFEAAVNRDYPVMFGTLYVYTLIGLVLNIVTDLTYMAVDPRIDFERRDA